MLGREPASYLRPLFFLVTLFEVQNKQKSNPQVASICRITTIKYKYNSIFVKSF